MKKEAFILSLYSILLLTTVVVIARRQPNRNGQTACSIAEQLEIKRAFGIDNIIPIAIAGSGPAGLTAALYAARAKIHTVVFTGKIPGGQLTNTTYVENWPGIKKTLGYEIMDTLKEQAEEPGAVIIEDTITSVDFSQWPFTLITGSGTKVHALSLVIATGSAPRRLGIPGELDYWGKGVTPCAVCDCAFFKAKDVVIIGGGDAAIEEAIQLASYAKTVTILVRKDRLKAVGRMQDKLADYTNIKVVYNKQILEIVGDGHTVTGIKVKDLETDGVSLIVAQGVFLAIGHNPNTDLFAHSLKVTPDGHIELQGRTQATSIKGVFAAGDVEDAQFRQAVVASAHGCQAALEAISWLRSIGLTELVAHKLQSRYFGEIKRL